jgi:hypothetical protein
MPAATLARRASVVAQIQNEKPRHRLGQRGRNKPKSAGIAFPHSSSLAQVQRLPKRKRRRRSPAAASLLGG